MQLEHYNLKLQLVIGLMVKWLICHCTTYVIDFKNHAEMLGLTAKLPWQWTCNTYLWMTPFGCLGGLHVMLIELDESATPTMCNVALAWNVSVWFYPLQFSCNYCREIIPWLCGLAQPKFSIKAHTSSVSCWYLAENSVVVYCLHDAFMTAL